MAKSLTLATRALGLASCFLAIGGGLESSEAQDCYNYPSDAKWGIVAPAFAVAGLAVFDIVTAPASVRRHNERRVSVAPYVNPHDRSYGVSVSWDYRKSTPVRRPPARLLPGGSGDPAHSRKSPLAGFALSLVSTGAPMAAGAFAANEGYNFGGGVALIAGARRSQRRALLCRSGRPGSRDGCAPGSGHSRHGRLLNPLLGQLRAEPASRPVRCEGAHARTKHRRPRGAASAAAPL